MRSSFENSRYHAFPDLGVEMLQARFTTHRYARHSHDAYAIGLTQEGVQSFRCRGALRHGLPGSVLSINPDEMHDGHSGTSGGYAYCMLYISPGTVVDALEEARERPAAAPLFLAPLLSDAEVALGIRRLRDALLRGAQPLERETALQDLLGVLFARHIERVARPAEPQDASQKSLRDVRDFLHANFRAPLSLRELSAVAGMSRFRLNSGFRKTFGLPPHAYLTRVRLSAARALVEAGAPLAAVAVEVGFVDQSHFTRHCKAWLGVTPGAFRRPPHTNVQS